MKSWEDIVNKALLGSEKASLRVADIPASIAQEYDLVASGNHEEDFLRFTSLVYQFRQGGAHPLDFNAVKSVEAAVETKQYCSTQANDTLKIILDEELPQLLYLWLQTCASRQEVVSPEMIPALLDIALRKKELRKVIVEVTGNRGLWLATINPPWNFSLPAEDAKTVWDTGTPEQRKEVLRELRIANPEEGRNILESTWTTEGANEKVSFLDILKINLSKSDLPWLESLKEKGQKVNNASLELLKLIPESAVVQNYRNILSEAVGIKTGKALLGMINKTMLQVDESVAVPDAVFKTGIEKLSSDKNVTDSKYILAQLISAVPPSFWNQHLSHSTPEIIELVQKEKNTAFYLPAIAMAAIRFKDQEWIKYILDKADRDIIRSSVVSMIGALPAVDRDRYALKFLKDSPHDIIGLMANSDVEWSMELAKAILAQTAHEVYSYNRTFYRPVMALIPVGILDILDSFIPNDENKKVYWKSQSDELARLLTIKLQTLQSFNA
ncbi:DUF5691 domain-containing protein [Ohtaekwangia kribbensis]|uniref:DUF5691 domain-containing protein n=1 Tax=Ohtaekwangia kribbensis TaxID=688913 RepID=A0ABW3K9I0_9BACT